MSCNREDVPWPPALLRSCLRKSGACLLPMAILRSSWDIGMNFNPRKALSASWGSLPFLDCIRCCGSTSLQGTWSLSGARLQLSLPSHHLEAEGKVKSSIIFLSSPLVYHCLIVSLKLIKVCGDSLPWRGGNRAEEI